MSRSPVDPTELMDLSFSLDGEAVTVSAPPKESALTVLREQLGKHRLKPGCSPQGICGSCAAVINGKVRLTCTLPAKSLDGKELTTLDGIPEAEAQQIALAFAAEGAVQCAYCLPGIVTQTWLLLQHVPDPDDEILRKALQLHLCRCTGWSAVRAGVRRAAALRRGESVPASSLRLRAARLDAALGRRPVVEDLVRPGMLHAAPVFLEEAGGRLAELGLDEALASEGVRAVLTAGDLPEGVRDSFGRPWLVARGESFRGPGNVAALVVAETAAWARLGASRVQVGIEAAEVPTHDLGTVSHAWGEPGGDTHTRVEVEVQTASIDPQWLEPEAALAVPGPQLTVWSNALDPAEDRVAVGQLTGCGPEELRVVLLPNGGAFGGRRDGFVAGLAAAAARQTGAPVRLSLTMEEATLRHGVQPGARLRVGLGATADGRLQRVEISGSLACGAVELADPALLHGVREAAWTPYAVPSSAVEVRLEQSSGPPAAAHSAPGLAPVAFAVERAVDALALALGRDARALRLDNLAPADRVVLEGLPTGGQVALAALVLPPAPAGEVQLRWGPGSTAEVSLPLGDDGLGLHDRVAERVAEALDLPLDAVQTASISTRAEPDRLVRPAHVLGALDGLLAQCRDARARGAVPEGQRFSAGLILGPEPVALAACRVSLDGAGALQDVQLRVRAGRLRAPLAAREVVRGGALRGLGRALSEQVATDEAGYPDTRFRSLGALKEKHSPELGVELLDVPDGAWLGADAGADVAEAAVPAAIAAALEVAGGASGEPARVLPLDASSAASSLGLRPARPFGRRR